jgi:hypothetical protein
MRWIPCAPDGCGYTDRIWCSALVVQSGLEEMRWIPCAFYGCGYNHSHQVHTGSISSPQVHSARPVQNTVWGLSSFIVLLMMGIMMPETRWVTNFNKLQLNSIQLVLSSPYKSIFVLTIQKPWRKEECISWGPPCRSLICSWWRIISDRWPLGGNITWCFWS